MTNVRTLVFAGSALLLAAQPLVAQDLSEYRHFRLHGTLASVAAVGGLAPADAKLVHERPALIQELRWRPASTVGAVELEDPVREVMFNFYNDELFLIVVDYDQRRTEGLTDTDLIDAISATYGPAVLTSRNPRAPVVVAEPDVDIVVARWADADSSLTLLRGTYPSSLRLIVASKRLEAQARTAATQALRIEERDAPRRELAQERQRVDDRRVAAEKARTLNKPAFKP